VVVSHYALTELSAAAQAAYAEGLVSASTRAVVVVGLAADLAAFTGALVSQGFVLTQEKEDPSSFSWLVSLFVFRRGLPPAAC
jgi:hypothetical protein